jgi:hypothetical protein
MPEIGNGYVASVVSFASMHLAGLYNGRCGTTHKARLPSPIASIKVVNATAGRTQGALDTKNGMYRRRYFVAGSIVEQRLFAHRVRKHVLVSEFELIKGGASVEVQLENLYDPICGQDPTSPCDKANCTHTTKGVCDNFSGRCVTRSDGSCYPYYGLPCAQSSDCGDCFLEGMCVCSASNCCQPTHPTPPGPAPAPTKCHTDGNGCAGSFSTDVAFVLRQQRQFDSAGQPVTLHVGSTTLEDDAGHRPSVAIQTHTIPSKIVLQAGSVHSFVASVVSSVGEPVGYDIAAAAAREHASAVADADKLLAEHTEAWAELWLSRIEVEGEDDQPRAWDIQTHISSSFYYLVSSIRADWALGGLSPGGLASQNYEGAVFMDQELYMAQGLLMFHPELTLSAAQYRIDGKEAAAKIATLFGYDGLMFPWTSAAKGNAFACCSGHGSFENCLEQHITPDVAFFLQQIFRATGDFDWLKRSAFPVVKGVAQWLVSRVHKDADGSLHINGVMPIDEWCDQKSGCASPGISDDPQMNGMSISAMGFAIEAAELLQEPVPDEWREIFAGLPIPFDETRGIHTMPVGANGAPVISSPTSTSCPEDINYLTYPMAPSLNISAKVSRADMQFWSDGTKTCLENAGMTAPIHAISWLKMYPPNSTGANFAMNRSMLAVAYGSYNMRNEVDVHNTTVGGHFNNTHFLTGDGGFLQILLNGYGGLMLARQDGMRFNKPTLPEGVTKLRFVGLKYLGWIVDFSFNASQMVWNATQLKADSPGLCLVHGCNGSQCSSVLLLKTPVALAIGLIDWSEPVPGSNNTAWPKIGPCPNASAATS